MSQSTQPIVSTGQQMTDIRRRKATSFDQSKTRLAWILLTPTLILIAFVAVYPLIQTIYQSFFRWNPNLDTEATFVGLRNYQNLLTDEVFRTSIWTTIKFTFVSVLFEFAFGLGIALVINSNFKGRGLMRTAMLVPWAIPTVVSAQMWRWMYNDIYGPINDFLYRKVGILAEPVAFIANPNTSLWAAAAVDIWKTTPFVALLLLAGLQVIPDDVYEAAQIDGANAWQQFLRITLPLLRPAILVTLIFRTLDALRVFDVIFVMFGARPDTQTMSVYAQNVLVAYTEFGRGSAISVAIFLIIAIFVVAYVTFLKVEES